MFLSADIALLKKGLCKYCDNYIKEIMDRTGLTYPTVNNFFKLQKIRPSNATKIYETGLSIIKEMEAKEQSLKSELRQIVEENPTC